jgi:hypothetical protein
MRQSNCIAAGATTATRRPTLLTSGVLEQVPQLIRAGKTPEEIAAQFGCTVGTLRVKCSQRGISLRRPRPGELPKPPLRPPQHHPRLSVALPPSVMSILEARADREGVTGRKLAAALLKTIIADDLFTAVLDGEPD